MNILIKNAIVVPMMHHPSAITGQDETLYYNADTAVSDGKILAVGAIPDSFSPEKTVDGTGKILIPGLINAHTHLSMGLLRNYADDLDLFTWLNEKIWPVENVLTEEDIYIGSLLGAVEMIKSGTTAFADMYFEQEATCRAIEQAGIRANIGATFIGDIKDTESRFTKYEALINTWNGACSGRIQIDTAPHAIYTCSRETLLAAADFSAAHDNRIHIHLSETARENAELHEKEGLSPTQLLESVGIFERPVYAAHCVHMSSADIDIIQSHGVIPVHNPSSNLKLGNGFAPVTDFLKHGIPTAIGTDGASSNNNVNMMEEMHITSLIHKGNTGDPTVVSAYETLYMATMNGAKALGIEDRCGSIQAGKSADLILVNTETAHMQPLNNPISALVYSAQSSDIEMVICDGNIVMENGTVQTIDEKAIVRETAETIKNMLNRL